MSIEQPRPFLKWAGGKTALVPQILERIPTTWNRETDLYVEPFLGGGAVFFALQPDRALLSDANSKLINLYWQVQNVWEGVIKELDRLVWEYRGASDPEVYYQGARELLNVGAGPEHVRAALLIFINKTCFNGLWRENSSGLFNVPWGKNPRVGFPSADHLRVCSSVLCKRYVKVVGGTFEILDGKFDPRGALIYCDPPYVPVSKTANFTSYTRDGFTYADQLRLALQAAYWRNAGAHVILSQAADESLVDQYRRMGFKADLVQARRNINSKGGGRGPVGEYIIY